ncbi:hypothetical protein GJ496_006812 [Pomphorhynchus laevis]|nr:hypothetical protein GJ496_006812 [Pomphorhynchus laevis]
MRTAINGEVKEPKNFKGGNGVLEAIIITRRGNYSIALHPILPSQHKSARQSRSLDVLISHVVTDTIQVDREIVWRAYQSFKLATSPTCSTGAINMVGGSVNDWLPKTDGGVRPIVSKCACLRLSSQFARLLLPMQLGVATPNAIEKINTQASFPKLKALIDAVAALLDPQVTYLLLRHCVSGARITHLMQTIPQHVVTGFLRRLNIEIMPAFETVTAVLLNRHAQQLALFSTFVVLGFLTTASTPLALTLNFVGYEAACEQIAGLWPQKLQQMGMVSQSRLSSMIDKEAHRNLLEQVDQFDRARLLEVLNRHASVWLQVSPNRNQHSELPRPQFCVLRLRNPPDTGESLEKISNKHSNRSQSIQETDGTDFATLNFAREDI